MPYKDSVIAKLKNRQYAKKWYDTNKDSEEFKQKRSIKNRAQLTKRNIIAKASGTNMYQISTKSNIESSWRRFVREKWSSAKQHAKRDGRRFAVTIDELMALLTKHEHKCAVSRRPMIHRFRSPFSLSIDRIDSDGDYTIDNIQLVTQFVNLGKRKFSSSEIEVFFRRATK